MNMNSLGSVAIPDAEEMKKKAIEEATKKAIEALPWHMKILYTCCGCCMPKLEI